MSDLFATGGGSGPDTRRKPAKKAPAKPPAKKPKADEVPGL